jgi:hypothetical protein
MIKMHTDTIGIEAEESGEHLPFIARLRPESLPVPRASGIPNVVSVTVAA